ncbi:MAG TPA: ROK family protein [Vicinamibacterales bacterium]|nr:ROK family protein [Vicinamibacterales bacterium]
MIGVELLDGRAVALAVDEDGRVIARAAVDNPHVGAAANDALGQLTIPADGSIGLAAALPDAPAIAEAIDVIHRRFATVTPHSLVSAGTAAALAETWVGAARGAHDVAFFGVASHAVAGLVRGGVPVTGSRGRAASIAWLALNPVEREDYRRVGCLEAEVAAVGIVRRLVWRIKAGDRSRVQDRVGGDLAAITVDDVLDAARGGDGVSISVIRDTAKYLGMAAANLAVVVDPEVLVLGGVMATAADLLFEPVRVEIGRRLPRAIADALTIAPALLGPDAAAIGAARLASAAVPGGA